MRIVDITPKIEREQKKIRLAGYTRVSTKSDEQEHSFAAQILYYTNYVKDHPEYELVDIYADEGITGTDMEKREELNRLLRDCRQGKIDKVICKSLSRFARNTEELLFMIRMLKEFGVSIYFQDKDIDSEKLNMEMIVTFPGMAAQQESEAISGNVRWSVQKRMETGDYNCTFPAYGYERKNGELIVKEDEAEIVRKIFDMYLQGNGLQAIATQMNISNIPRRYGYMVWYQQSIKYLLTNERYKGDALLQKQFRTESLPHRQKRNKREKKQYFVKYSNPPIVYRKTYDMVQDLLKSKYKNFQITKTPLSGKLRCPECGSTFRRQVLRDKVYLMCEKRSSQVTQCQSRRVREDAVYDTFINMLYKLKTYRKEIVVDLLRQLEYLQNKQIQNKGEISRIDKEIADWAAKNLVMTRLRNSGALNEADFAQRFSEINGKLIELRKERRRQLTNEEDEQLNLLRDLNDILLEYQPTTRFEEDIFEQIVEKIIVDDNTKLTFCLIGGLQLTEEITEKLQCGYYENEETALRLQI